MITGLKRWWVGYCRPAYCPKCFEPYENSLPGFFKHRPICRPHEFLDTAAKEIDAEIGGPSVRSNFNLTSSPF